MGAYKSKPAYEDEILRLQRTCSRFAYLQKDIRKQYSEISTKKGIPSADRWLTNLVNDYLNLAVFPLTVESNDDEIKDSAEAMATKCERAIKHEIGLLKNAGASKKYRMQKAADLGMQIATTAGALFDISDLEREDVDALAGKLARLCAAKWWRKQLRTIHARSLETAARKLGLVSKRRGGYVSTNTLFRRRGQRARNRQIIEGIEAVNNEGQRYTLADLSDLGISNPANKRAELMTRISGFEEWAENDCGDYHALFITQTCPSRFHSHHKAGKQYPAWDGSGPRDAQGYLNQVWQEVRAAWDRENINPFGFRIAEPHHDGCPHWHMVLWVPKYLAKRTIQIYREHALKESPDQNGAYQRRLTVKLIRQRVLKTKQGNRYCKFPKSSATGYIAKYVSKNIDGLDSNDESWSSDSVRTAIRVEAWASTWGIRQFQQIGGAPVTVWRELRRISEDDTDCVEIEEIREAADSGDWSAFTDKMGGAICPRKDRPLHIEMLNRREDGELIRNDYGEVIRAIKGLIAFDWLPIKTRLYEWTIQPIKEVVEILNLRGPPGRALDLCQ